MYMMSLLLLICFSQPQAKVYGLLVTRSADVMYTAMTASVATRAGNATLTALLLRRRANPRAQNKQGKTPAEVATTDEVRSPRTPSSEPRPCTLHAHAAADEVCGLVPAPRMAPSAQNEPPPCICARMQPLVRYQWHLPCGSIGLYPRRFLSPDTPGPHPCNQTLTPKGPI